MGELVQLDGSFHDWLEGRGPDGCLMNMVDDASGDTLARLGSEETIWTAAGVLRAWVKKYGVPVALYTDWKNVYVREASQKEQMQGVVPVTQFGQMCQGLWIGIIAANSPQAKGRVERNHGTHQDRLVKKMRLKKIETHDEANRFLERNICPSTIGGSGVARRSPRTIIEPPEGIGVGGSFSSGNCASHRQRLGGAARQAIFSSEGASPAVCAGQGQSHGVGMGGRTTTDSLSRQGGGVGGDYRPGCSSGRNTQGDHGQESNAAHSQSGSPLAAGLSQDAPLEQTSDPDDAYYHDGLAFGFALSMFRNFKHPISEAGANWRQPKNNNSKLGGERLWKSRFVEKSTKRTFPLRLEIRTHRGFPLRFPLHAQPRLLLEIKNARPRQKRTFLMS